VTWRVITHADVGVNYLEQCAEWVGHTAPEAVAQRASEVLLSEAERAFAQKINPRTGELWAPWARNYGLGSLLVRTGALKGALRAGYQPNPAGARGFLNLDSSQIRKGLIHAYGVEAKSRRTYVRSKTGKIGSTRRKRAGARIPARMFYGFAPTRFRELIQFAEAELGKVVK
jgi:phage gpG-like protein